MTGISHSIAPIAVGAEPQVQPNGGTVMKIALYLSLFGILGLAIWWTIYAWTSDYGADAPMSMHGYIAMVLGIIGSLIVGCGLMGLLFYSSRRGYDEPAELDRDSRRDYNGTSQKDR